MRKQHIFVTVKFIFKPIDNSSLVLFRILFGLVLFVELAGAVAIGWVDEVYIDPNFTFTFIGFEWMQPLPGKGMYLVFLALSILALFIAIGYRYRLSVFLLFIGWGYVYLMHKCSYNNHHYLYWMLIGIFFFLPAHKYWSADLRAGRVKESLVCRWWHVHLFIGIYLVVYTYAAIAKLYPDWYHGIPLDIWFKAKSERPIIGAFYGWEYAPMLFAWGGKFFDFLIIPMLLWRRTRWVAVGLSLVFHILNSITFEIGTFPYMMIVSIVLFFPPEQIKARFFKNKQDPELQNVELPKNRILTQVVLVGYLTIQLLLPLRHHLYEGNVFWTEEGHRLSWRMMLRSKRGSASFEIRDNDNNLIHHNVHDHLTNKQFYTMSTHPDMIWQYVQYLKSLYGEDISVKVVDYVQLNKGPRVSMIDQDADLAKTEWHRFKHHDWITEFPGWSE